MRIIVRVSVSVLLSTFIVCPLSFIATVWDQQSSMCNDDRLRQRKGRAGRVREGICYHLFTKERYAVSRFSRKSAGRRLTVWEHTARTTGVSKSGNAENPVE